jgi:hypothetical protein
MRSTSSGSPPMIAGDLAGDLVGARGRQVDLVQDRDDLEVGLEREVEVRDRLRLHPLRGVDEQHRPLAGVQRPDTS